jgi:hypothetical protein
MTTAQKEKEAGLKTSKMFFNLPLDRMLRLMDELNEADEILFMNSQIFSADWHSSLRRREARFALMDFRINFELGMGAPLKDGTTCSNTEVAKDLMERGWINRDRFEVALRGERSKEYELALIRKKKNHEELEADLKRHRDNGWEIHDDGSVSLVPPRSMAH